MAIRRELDDLLDQCLGEDPRAALVAARRLATEHVPWLEARAVMHARANGWNWARIGRLLGRSRQAVRERYVAITPAAAPAPASPDPSLAWFRMHDGFRRLREFQSDQDQIAW